MNPSQGSGLFTFGGQSGFGAPQQQPQQAQQPAPTPFTFGQPAAAQPQQQLQQQQPPTAAPTPFTFGQPRPAATAPQTGGLFGSSFGQTAAPSSSTPGTGLFGSTPTATVTPFGSTTLGSTAQPTAAPSTGFSLGSTLGTAPAATTSTASTGFSFGQPAAAAAPTVSTTTISTPASTGFSFGQPAASTASTITTAQPTLGGGLFGSTTTSTSATATTAQPSSSLFSGITPSTSVAATSAAPATGFSFGSNLGATTTSATTTTPSLLPTTSLSFGTTFGQPAAAAPTTAPSGGLGGVPKYATTGAETTFAFGGGSTDGKSENRALKELPLPQEMLVLVEELKNQIKSNKMKFTELTRSTNETIISKVAEEIEEVRNSVTNIGNLIHKQLSNCEAIHNLIQQGISNAEMANITRETPLGSQADHTSPIQYFFKLIESFRDRMTIYLREIEKAENSLAYVLSAQSGFTSQELFNALKGTRDSVITLSAKVQMLHEEVIREIEAHRNLQRYILGETKELKVSTPTGQQQGFSSSSRPFMFESRRENTSNGIYSKASLLFPHKLVEPPKCQILNMSQTLTTGAKSTSPPAKTSTPYFSRYPSTQLRDNPAKAGDSLFFPSTSLFQTQQSTILSSTQLPSSSPISGMSLKRTKHL